MKKRNRRRGRRKITEVSCTSVCPYKLHSLVSEIMQVKKCYFLPSQALIAHLSLNANDFSLRRLY